jgi:hypothetical protein
LFADDVKAVKLLTLTANGELLEKKIQLAGESGVGGVLVGADDKAEFVLLLRTLSVPLVV